MDPHAEVTLWRAPPSSCQDPGREVLAGYAAEDYPGDGLYVASDKQIAIAFAECYGNGLQEIHVPGALFQTLVEKGVVQVDGFYPAGQSWHVPPAGLIEFVEAIRRGTPGRYHPPLDDRAEGSQA